MTTGGPRARYREQTRTEIKEIALHQLSEGGIAAVTLTRIAKELELSGPALYRYFANRDALLGSLIGDAYQDLATAIGQAAQASAKYTPRHRLLSLAGSYRDWAVAQPHRYLLIAGTPLPGYSAPPETLTQARAALGPFLPLFAAAQPHPAVLPVAEQMDTWAHQDPAVADWVAQYLDNPHGAGHALAGAVTAWTRIHGVVSLEVQGLYEGMGHQPQTLLEAEMNTLADAFRLD
ncbi:TetR/AcrR family transcriptional regulator [Streptomyces sp. NRRL F-5123]|uniref:TetR/AcrR family transcriptional regulator n=1 Tax=Streptomyces sp. NRRL F-5123 TaxID=1463856 RepID=UPI0004E0D7FB|nr:TetR/AcrR family transcriptional regulator [Streptomyces sp. NRRL F-5123]